jgi:hypothetical protein
VSQEADRLVIGYARNPGLERGSFGIIPIYIIKDLDEDILIDLFGILDDRDDSHHLCKDITTIEVEHLLLGFGTFLDQSRYEVCLGFCHDYFSLTFIYTQKMTETLQTKEKNF